MLNTVALMGRLTADPELKRTSNDIAVTTFTLAVNRSYVRQGEERQTDFITVVAWRQTAEFVCRYFAKGQLMAVDGSIQTRNYTDRDGNKRTAFEVVAGNVHFAESKGAGGGGMREQRNESVFEPSTDVMSFSTGNDSDFQEITSDDDLPF